MGSLKRYFKGLITDPQGFQAFLRITDFFQKICTRSSLGWGGIIGSYISMGVSKLPVDMKPERWGLIFFVLGSVTCLWAFVIWFVLPDSPSNAWFLSQRERLVAVKRVSDNETGIKNKAFEKKQGLVGFFDPKTLLLFTSVFAAAIPNGVVNSFSTVIIRDMGFDTTKTTQLKSVGDAVQIVALLIGGTFILNIPDSRLITASVANLLCTVSAACMAYLPASNTWGRLFAFWLVNSQSVGFTVSLTTISSNMAGYTHRSLASAMVFTAYCWGNFAGPFVVKPSEAPHFRGATIGLLVGYAIKFVCHLSLLFYMFFVNQYRKNEYGEPDRERSKEAGMRDQTEFENMDFRYVL
ncbi:MFS transporter [Colletotrichum sojae]|uniref:MFS transporter n=1 Tax=Colletotrichum sojae TaxID=2175907 RepID=A0A8H6IW38_9PEZI|nr:MFS transporter [Colletotrichum sojae]